MMQFSMQMFLFNVLCILNTTSEDHVPTFSSFTLTKEKKYTVDSTYDCIIRQLDNPTHILQPEDKSLSVSERLETSMEIAPSGSRTNAEYNPFTYVHQLLWKGTEPDMLYKRARSGFVGMRGKKDNEFIENGKKQPSGLFGMRGKKYPYEFRGKFVGVRGKKISHDLPNKVNFNLDSLKQELHPNQLMLVLTEQNESDDSGDN